MQLNFSEHFQAWCMAEMIQHASLHCDTVSAAQIATSFIPHFPSTGMQLSATVFFQEIEKENKRKVNSWSALEGMVSFLSSMHNKIISFFKQVSTSSSQHASYQKQVCNTLLVCPSHRSEKKKKKTGAVQGIQCIDKRRGIRPALHLYPVTHSTLRMRKDTDNL